MTTPDLNAIKARLAAALRGPWTLNRDEGLLGDAWSVVGPEGEKLCTGELARFYEEEDPPPGDGYEDATLEAT